MSQPVSAHRKLPRLPLQGMRKEGLLFFPKQNETEDLIYLALESTVVK